MSPARRTTPVFTADHAEQLDKALTAAGVEHTIETYPAAHGFAVPDNASYDAAAADRHWTRCVSSSGRTWGNLRGRVERSS